MALNKNKDLKLYYSIKEVAQQVGVSESTLRYWEKEFPQLQPHVQSGNKVRQYTTSDIELIRTIYSLVKVRGLKLAAARRVVNANRKGADKTGEILERLISVREELRTLKQQLDGLV